MIGSLRKISDKALAQSLIVTLPKMGNLQQKGAACSSASFTELSALLAIGGKSAESHFNRLNNQAKEILVERQAGFKARRSTIQLILAEESYVKSTFSTRKIYLCLHRPQKRLEQGVSSCLLMHHTEVQ